MYLERGLKEVIGDYSINIEITRIDNIYEKLNNQEKEMKTTSQYNIFRDSYNSLKGVNKRMQDVIRRLSSILSSIEKSLI